LFFNMGLCHMVGPNAPPHSDAKVAAADEARRRLADTAAAAPAEYTSLDQIIGLIPANLYPQRAADWTRERTITLNDMLRSRRKEAHLRLRPPEEADLGLAGPPPRVWVGVRRIPGDCNDRHVCLERSGAAERGGPDRWDGGSRRDRVGLAGNGRSDRRGVVYPPLA
jgi:hypothetical protein